MVVAQVRQFERQGGPCFLSNEGFGILLSVSDDRASKIISDLIKKGELVIDKSKFDGRRRFLSEKKDRSTIPSSIVVSNEAASADTTDTSESSIGVSNEAASSDTTNTEEKHLGCLGESDELIINRISIIIKYIVKSKYFSNNEYLAFKRYVLEKKKTPDGKDLDSEENIIEFAKEWYSKNPEDTWLPKVNGDYGRHIFAKISRKYKSFPEMIIQIASIQQDAGTNTIIFLLYGNEDWFNAHTEEIRHLLGNYSKDDSLPNILFKSI